MRVDKRWGLDWLSTGKKKGYVCQVFIQLISLQWGGMKTKNVCHVYIIDITIY